MAKIVELIETENEYWTKDGKLVAVKQQLPTSDFLEEAMGVLRQYDHIHGQPFYIAIFSDGSGRVHKCGGDHVRDSAFGPYNSHSDSDRLRIIREAMARL